MDIYCRNFHGNRLVCVAQHKETKQIVGWGYAYFQFSFFELGTYILPDHRGNGIGKEIVIQCIKYGLSRNKFGVRFYFNTHSKDAERLYFSAFDEFPNEYLECDSDEWHLVRVKKKI